ncbi:MAG: hypothetical protein RIQ56_758 [Candidatus Parcubacteria bacterium]|jgi:hypothetical protein
MWYGPQETWSKRRKAMMPYSAQDLAVAMQVQCAVSGLDSLARTDERFKRWPEVLSSGFDFADAGRSPLAVLLGPEGAREYLRALPRQQYEEMVFFYTGCDLPTELLNVALRAHVLDRLSAAACS